MYLQFYNLKKKPFEITTDPKFLWLGEKHKEALATLEYGIREEKGFLLMTGDVGTGKTVLIRGLARTLNVQSIIATVPDPGLDPLDLFNSLATSFKMGQQFKSKGEFLAHLKKFLIKSAAGKQRVLLIIDEAQRLNHNLLEEIRLLSNIELDNQKLINIFFVGQPEFNDNLMKSRSKAVRHRITIRYHIEPLTEEEIGKYIRHRLKIAGTIQKLFTAAAIREIFAFSGGNPRLTNIICDHALLSGYSADLKIIDADVIKECAEELRLPPEKKKREEEQKIVAAPAPPAAEATPVKQRPVAAYTAIALVAILVIVGGYFLSKPEPQKSRTWSIEEMAPQKPKEVFSAQSDLKEATINSDTESGSSAHENKLVEIEAEGELITGKKPEISPGSETDNAEKALNLKEIQKIVLHFKHNSNELPDQTYRTLDRFASALLEDHGFEVTVRGYTDSTGVLSYNLSVSEFRANLIKSYLVGKGVTPSRISVVGMGPEDPIASNETEDGRRQNRRVEIEFIAKNTEAVRSN